MNWRAIGKASTLVTAHITEDELKEVVEAVDGLEGVSHNYLRDHYFNLWFTLRADSQKKLESILKRMGKQFGTEFHSLPVERVFKLDVRFDAESDGQRLLTTGTGGGWRTEDGGQRTEDGKRRTTDEIDERILAGLQRGLEAVAQPFDFLCEDRMRIDEVLSRIEKMIREEVIYRVGAVVNHHKLGFVANAMFVCRADKRRIIETGERLAKLDMVSHCYQRRTFENWPYDIFAMMHGRNMRDIHQGIEGFVKAEGIKDWELLPTKAALKNSIVVNRTGFK